MLSVGYIVAALAGKLIFGEPVDAVRWLGILTICFGVYLIKASTDSYLLQVCRAKTKLKKPVSRFQALFYSERSKLQYYQIHYCSGSLS